MAGADAADQLKQMEQRVLDAKHELTRAEDALERAPYSGKDPAKLQERVDLARREHALAQSALDERDVPGRIKRQEQEAAEADAADDAGGDPNAWDDKNRAENEVTRLKGSQFFGCSLPLVVVLLVLGVVLATTGILLFGSDDDAKSNSESAATEIATPTAESSGDADSETANTSADSATATEDFSGHYSGTRSFVGSPPEPGVVHCEAITVVLDLDVVQTASNFEVLITGGVSTGLVARGSVQPSAAGEVAFEWTVDTEYGRETWTGRFVSNGESRTIEGTVVAEEPGCDGPITATG